MTGEGTLDDLSLCVFPPNKPLEAKIEFSTKPVVYDHLLFLDSNTKGEWILGSSSITSTFWEGTLLYFKDFDNLQKFNYTGHYIYATTTDGKFLNDTTIALAEDTGILTILNINNDSLQPVIYYRHAQRIGEIAVWKDTSKILTCSGRGVVIWDINIADKKPYLKYDDYHCSEINSVDVLQTDSKLFVTASNDRKCCIWDTRMDVPASVLYSNEFCAIQNVKWNQKATNYIVAGTRSGKIYLLDKREPKEFLSVQHCYNNSIHKIALNDSDKIAVGGNTNEVIILALNNGNMELVSKHSKHTDFVRGLKWQEDVLYSCGFDKKIIKHVI